MATWAMNHPFLTLFSYLLHGGVVAGALPAQRLDLPMDDPRLLHHASAHVPTQCMFTPTCSH